MVWLISLPSDGSGVSDAKDSSIVRGVVLWPSVAAGRSLDTILGMISQEMEVLRSIPIDPMDQEQFRRLIVDLYRGQDFIGTSEEGYPLSRDKAHGCWRSGEKTEAILVRVPSLDRLNELKEAIRMSRKDLGKHAVHTTDSDEETAKLISVARGYSTVPLVGPSFGLLECRQSGPSSVELRLQKRRLGR